MLTPWRSPIYFAGVSRIHRSGILLIEPYLPKNGATGMWRLAWLERCCGQVTRDSYKAAVEHAICRISHA
jgi:hypothetical protein